MICFILGQHEFVFGINLNGVTKELSDKLIIFDDQFQLLIMAYITGEEKYYDGICSWRIWLGEYIVN